MGFGFFWLESEVNLLNGRVGFVFLVFRVVDNKFFGWIMLMGWIVFNGWGGGRLFIGKCRGKGIVDFCIVIFCVNFLGGVFIICFWSEVFIGFFIVFKMDVELMFLMKVKDIFEVLELDFVFFLRSLFFCFLMFLVGLVSLIDSLVVLVVVCWVVFLCLW